MTPIAARAESICIEETLPAGFALQGTLSFSESQTGIRVVVEPELRQADKQVMGITLLFGAPSVHPGVISERELDRVASKLRLTLWSPTEDSSRFPSAEFFVGRATEDVTLVISLQTTDSRLSYCGLEYALKVDTRRFKQRLREPITVPLDGSASLRQH